MEMNKEKAILVVGGFREDSKSVEAIKSDGTPLCALPDLPAERFSHTADDGLICGDYNAQKSCLKYEAGKWVEFGWKLLQKRQLHVSWKRPDGEVQLMGGFENESSRTTEVVTDSGSKQGFPLKHDTKGACAIKLKDIVVITGGNTSMATVTSYDMDGWLMNLPDLNTGRSLHGCGHYRNDAGEMVQFGTGSSKKGLFQFLF